MKFIYKYFLWSLSIIIISIMVYFFFQLVMPISSGTEIVEYRVRGWAYSKEIIANNIKNFIQFQLLFIVAPLLVFMDIFMNVLQIYVSNQLIGTVATFKLIVVHGWIELPNLLLYSFLSVYKFYLLWKYRKIGIIISFMKENYKIYLCSILVIVVSGILEGVI
ncbi:hypothetical protein IGJ55_003354 [Enterococcus sp. AZ170]|uniref:hypothetical protein n=1 Tax=Enterococcus sp. AZ170 TaxID=2774747 RepID=UPI003D2FE75C